MKKILQRLLTIVAIAAFGSINAQPMNGVYTIAGTSPNYATLSAAISDLNSRGVNGPVIFNIRDGVYTATTWRGQINAVAGASATNRITFRSEAGNKANVTINLAGASGLNYIFRLNNANFISIKDLTLINTSTSYGTIVDFGTTSSNDSLLNCTLTGATIYSSSYTTMALVYAYGYTGSNVVFHNNLFQNGGTWATWYGSSTTTTTNDTKFIGNTFSMINSGYYGIFAYYTSGLKFLNNTFVYNGASTYYNTYIYYANNDFEFSNNTLNLTTTSSLYSFLAQYVNYYSNSSTSFPKVYDNTFNSTSTSSGTIYDMYTAYWYYGHFKGNTVNNVNATGTSYLYGPLYMNNNSKAENNTFNFNPTSTSSYYNMSTYMGGGIYTDTFSNNVHNINGKGGTIYNYMGYYGSTVITDNVYNVTNTGGTTYNRIDYGQGLTFARNKVTTTTTTGTLYGLYLYNTTSYNGAFIYQNDFNFSSTSGTVYGIQAYYLNGEKFYNNVVTTKTAGANYTLYLNYTYSCSFKNNTFYSLATGTTDYLTYIYQGSTSYKAEFKNNIFAKSSSNGYGMWAYDNNFTADYNLYYVPGGVQFYMQTPAYTGSSLQSWRTALGSDYNSLVYQPPFINAAARDFRIDPASPNAWAVNGRAEHDTLIKADMAAVSRPILRTTGVPDIGAYEVTPTSTPPNAVATPANPVANGTQVFTFGQDTVASIAWGATVPATYSMRQYSGLQAAPIPAGVGKMYFYAAGTPATWVHSYKPRINYKDIWLGTIPTESEAVIARSSNGGAWEGYNYTNAATNTTLNILSPAANFDSVGSFTGVQNGRIGIRCVENPKGIAITNITAFVADIDWQAVFNPIGYQVIVKTNSKSPTKSEWNAASFAPTNSLAAGGLAEDTKYFVFIRSICGVKDTSGYSLDSFETLITCHTPTIAITDINDGRAVVSWTAVKTVTKYEYVMTKSSAPPSFGTEINKNSVLAPFLDDGTEYFVHVRAHCSSMYNISNWSSASFNTWKTGINNLAVSGSGLHVYPNPVRNEMVITIGGASTESGTISLLDMTGKVLKTQTVTGNKVTINVTELPAGMYMAQYTSDTRREQVKFNKQ